MSAVLDILSSPLKSYITQYLEYYLSKYIKGIQLEGLGVFGGDLVFNDLEIRRHVLQSSLEIPSTFDFSRGFIREMRINIPWRNLFSQPIEVKLYTIELILTSTDHDIKRQRSHSLDDQSSRQATPDLDSKHEVNENAPKTGWLHNVLKKILANITIQVNNLVLKYEKDDVVFSVALGLLDIYSCNSINNWRRGYSEPYGERSTICKTIDAKDITIFLDRYKINRKYSNDKASEVDRRVVGYEVPVLNRTTISARCKLDLDPYSSACSSSVSPVRSANSCRDTSSPLHKRSSISSIVSEEESCQTQFVSTGCSNRKPSIFVDPFDTVHDINSVVSSERLSIVVAIADIYVKSLVFSLSDRQVLMLGEMCPEFAQRETECCISQVVDSSKRSTSPSQDKKSDFMCNETCSIDSPEAVGIGRSSIHELDTTEHIDQSSNPKPAWFSWAVDAVLGNNMDNKEDLLEKELLAESEEQLQLNGRRSLDQQGGPIPSSSRRPNFLSIDNAVDEEESCLNFAIILKMCIVDMSVEIRKHMADRRKDEEIINRNERCFFGGTEDYNDLVPVANVGMVKIPFQHLRKKSRTQKPAVPVCLFHVENFLFDMEMTFDNAVSSSPYQDIRIDLEKVEIMELNIKKETEISGRHETPPFSNILDWGGIQWKEGTSWLAHSYPKETLYPEYYNGGKSEIKKEKIISDDETLFCKLFYENEQQRNEYHSSSSSEKGQLFWMVESTKMKTDKCVTARSCNCDCSVVTAPYSAVKNAACSIAVQFVSEANQACFEDLIVRKLTNLNCEIPSNLLSIKHYLVEYKYLSQRNKEIDLEKILISFLLRKTKHSCWNHSYYRNDDYIARNGGNSAIRLRMINSFIKNENRRISCDISLAPFHLKYSAALINMLIEIFDVFHNFKTEEKVQQEVEAAWQSTQISSFKSLFSGLTFLMTIPQVTISIAPCTASGSCVPVMECLQFSLGEGVLSYQDSLNISFSTLRLQCGTTVIFYTHSFSFAFQQPLLSCTMSLCMDEIGGEVSLANLIDVFTRIETLMSLLLFSVDIDSDYVREMNTKSCFFFSLSNLGISVQFKEKIDNLFHLDFEGTLGDASILTSIDKLKIPQPIFLCQNLIQTQIAIEFSSALPYSKFPIALPTVHQIQNMLCIELCVGPIHFYWYSFANAYNDFMKYEELLRFLLHPQREIKADLKEKVKVKLLKLRDCKIEVRVHPGVIFLTQFVCLSIPDVVLKTTKCVTNQQDNCFSLALELMLTELSLYFDQSKVKVADKLVVLFPLSMSGSVELLVYDSENFSINSTFVCNYIDVNVSRYVLRLLCSIPVLTTGVLSDEIISSTQSPREISFQWQNSISFEGLKLNLEIGPKSSAVLSEYWRDRCLDDWPNLIQLEIKNALAGFEIQIGFSFGHLDMQFCIENLHIFQSTCVDKVNCTGNDLFKLDQSVLLRIMLNLTTEELFSLADAIGYDINYPDKKINENSPDSVSFQPILNWKIVNSIVIFLQRKSHYDTSKKDFISHSPIMSTLSQGASNSPIKFGNNCPSTSFRYPLISLFYRHYKNDVRKRNVKENHHMFSLSIDKIDFLFSNSTLVAFTYLIENVELLSVKVIQKPKRSRISSEKANTALVDQGVVVDDIAPIQFSIAVDQIRFIFQECRKVNTASSKTSMMCVEYFEVKSFPWVLDHLANSLNAAVFNVLWLPRHPKYFEVAATNELFTTAGSSNYSTQCRLGPINGTILYDKFWVFSEENFNDVNSTSYFSPLDRYEILSSNASGSISSDVFLYPFTLLFNLKQKEEQLSVHVTKISMESTSHQYQFLAMQGRDVSYVLSIISRISLGLSHSEGSMINFDKKQKATSNLSQLKIQLDGIELELKGPICERQDAVKLHVINASLTQDWKESSGHAHLGNFSCGYIFQQSLQKRMGCIILGPFCDPYEWISQPEKYPDVILNLKWNGSRHDKKGIALHGFLKALQCQVSVQLVTSLIQFLSLPFTDRHSSSAFISHLSVKKRHRKIRKCADIDNMMTLSMKMFVAPSSVLLSLNELNTASSTSKQGMVHISLGQIFSHVVIGKPQSSFVTTLLNHLNTKFLYELFSIQLALSDLHLAVFAQHICYPIEQAVIFSVSSSLHSLLREEEVEKEDSKFKNDVLVMDNWACYLETLRKLSIQHQLVAKVSFKVDFSVMSLLDLKLLELKGKKKQLVYLTTDFKQSVIFFESDKLICNITPTIVATLSEFIGSISAIFPNSSNSTKKNSSAYSNYKKHEELIQHHLGCDDFSVMSRVAEPRSPNAGELVLDENPMVTEPNHISDDKEHEVELLTTLGSECNETINVKYENAKKALLHVEEFNLPWKIKKDCQNNIDEKLTVTDEKYSWMKMKWKYHLPRRVLRLLCFPVPFPPNGLPLGWPRTSFDLHCDFVCELRYFDLRKKQFFTAGSGVFYAPVEEEIPKVEENYTGDFASMFNLWVDNDDDLDEKKKKYLTLKNLKHQRFVEFVGSPAACEWEIRWRLPSLDMVQSISKDEYLLLNSLFAASIQVYSCQLNCDLALLNASACIPEISISLLENKKTTVPQDEEILCVRVEGNTLNIYGDNLLFFKTNAFSVEVQNFITLARTLLLEPLAIHYSLNCATAYLHLENVALNLSQTTLKTIWNLEQLYTGNFENQEYVAKTRMYISNCLGESIFYGQYNTMEEILLPSLAIQSYSWRSITAEISSSSLYFSHCQNNKNIDPCCINMNLSSIQGYRIHDHCRIWVCVEVKELCVYITLRADIGILNKLPIPVNLRISNTIQQSEASRNSLFFYLPAFSFNFKVDGTTINNEWEVSNGRNLNDLNRVFLSEQQAWKIQFGICEEGEWSQQSVSTSDKNASFHLISINSMYFCVVLKRVSYFVNPTPGALLSDLNNDDSDLTKQAWLTIELLPYLTVYNSLPLAVEVQLDKVDGLTEKKVIPSECSLLIVEWNPTSKCILRFYYDKICSTFTVPPCSTESQSISHHPEFESITLRQLLPDFETYVPLKLVSFKPSHSFYNDLKEDLWLEFSRSNSYLSRLELKSNTKETLLFRGMIQDIEIKVGVKIEYIDKEIKWSEKLDIGSQLGSNLIKRTIVIDHLHTQSLINLTVKECNYSSCPICIQFEPTFLIQNLSGIDLEMKPTSESVTMMTSTRPKTLIKNEEWSPLGLISKPIEKKSNSKINGSLGWIRSRLQSSDSTDLNPHIQTAVKSRTTSFSRSLVFNYAIRLNGSSYWSAAQHVYISSLARSSKNKVDNNIGLHDKLCQSIRHRVYLSDCCTMLSYSVVVNEQNEQIHLVFFVDPQPPVRIFNCTFSILAIKTPQNDAAHTLPAQSTVDYDWNIGNKSEKKASTDASLMYTTFRAGLLKEMENFIEWSDIDLWQKHEFQQKIDFSSTSFRIKCVYAAGTWEIYFEPCDFIRHEDVYVSSSFSLAIDCFTVSFFDEQQIVQLPQPCWRELVRLSMKHIEFTTITNIINSSYCTGSSQFVIEKQRNRSTNQLKLQDLEIDHFIETCNFPVILSFSSTSNAMETSWIVEYPDILSTKPISYIDTAHLTVSPFQIELEDRLIVYLARVLIPLWGLYPISQVNTSSKILAVPRRLYIGSVIISPIDLTLTACGSLIFVVGGFSRLPVKFNEVRMTYIYQFFPHFMKDLAANYVADTILAAPLVLGSLDFLGNPAGFVRSIFAGVGDLFWIPLSTFSDGFGPLRLSQGIAKGVVSLIRHASVGTLSSISGFSSSVARSMDSLSMSSEQYNTRSYAQSLNVSGGLVDGFNQLLGAATGVVTTPLTIYTQSKRSGSLKGISKGLLGMVARPVAGVASFVSHTSDGILYGTMSQNMIHLPKESVLLLPCVLNLALLYRLKVLPDEIPGEIMLVDGIWSVDSLRLNNDPISKDQARIENACNHEIPVTLVLSEDFFYIVIVASDGKEVVNRKGRLIEIARIEENLQEPTKFAFCLNILGVKPSYLEWFRFKLSSADRRKVSSWIRTALKDFKCHTI